MRLTVKTGAAVLFYKIENGAPTSDRVALPAGNYPAQEVTIKEKHPETKRMTPVKWVTLTVKGKTYGLDEWDSASRLNKLPTGDYETKL